MKIYSVIMHGHNLQVFTAKEQEHPGNKVIRMRLDSYLNYQRTTALQSLTSDIELNK